ncbi:MAG: hypothetical protein U0793_13570, partial [Gemmataceae bacterium]
AHSLVNLRSSAGQPIPALIIPGNHDPADSASLWTAFRQALAGASSVHLLLSAEAVELMDGKLVVEAYPCLTRFSPEPPWAARLPRRPGPARVVLAHGTLQGGPVPEGETDAYPFTERDLQALEADYVALGHFHGLYPPWGDSDECRRAFCYCGTHEPDQFTGDAGYALLATIHPGQTPSLRRVKTGKRDWRQLTLRGSADLDRVDRLLEEIKASPEPSRFVVRLKVRGGADWAGAGDRLDRLEASLRANGVHTERRGAIRPSVNLADFDLQALASGAIKEALLDLAKEMERTTDDERRALLAVALQLGRDKVQDGDQA